MAAPRAAAAACSRRRHAAAAAGMRSRAWHGCLTPCVVSNCALLRAGTWSVCAIWWTPLAWRPAQSRWTCCATLVRTWGHGGTAQSTATAPLLCGCAQTRRRVHALRSRPTAPSCNALRHLLAPAAGGWLGRAFLGQAAFKGSPQELVSADSLGSADLEPNPAVRALVTLGTPHTPPPPDKVRVLPRTRLPPPS